MSCSCFAIDFSRDVERLGNELAELKVKLQERETVLDKMQRERKTLDEDMKLLQEQVHSYDTDFVAERQSREKLLRDYQKLQQQLKEKEQQLYRFHNYFATNKCAQDELATDNNQLRQQISQVTNECEQLRRSEQQNHDRLAQLSNRITTELQIKEHVSAENQNLRDNLQMKESEIHRLNTMCSFQRQQFTTENDRLKERIHTLELTVDTKYQQQVSLNGNSMH